MSGSNSEKKDYGAMYGAVGVMGVALILAEIAVFFIYSWLEPEAMTRRMSVTAVVTILVSYPIGYYIHQQNAKLQQLTKELARIASTDQMSGLLNRTSFLQAVEGALHTPLGGPTAGSFLFIDVDHFKKLNDRFGHCVGDDAIKLIADIIKETPAKDSIVGRMGGEEFGLFLPHANKKEAISIAENVRRRVRRLIFDKGPIRQQISVSIGLSMHHAGQSLSAFVQQADERMYLAKAQGRNRVAYEDAKTPSVGQTPIKHSA